MPKTEIEEYLIAMLRELDRHRPAAGWAVASHGIIWDQHWERLVLLVNVGDAVYLHPLYPGALTSDPIATAASLAGKVGPEVWQHLDADTILFKR